MAGQSERSSYIDAFRGFAILGVLFHHFFYQQIAAAYPFEASRFPSPAALNHGHLGVGLFFILSGMVFYRPNIADDWGRVLRFYLQRALRLWPLYILTILLLGYLKQYDLFTFATSFALLLTGIHDFIPRYWEPSWALWVLWSLGVEIIFSISLPALLLAERRLGFARVLILTVVFCFVYRTVGDHVWMTRHPDYSNPFLNPLKDNFIGRLDDFLFGMAAMRAVRNDISIRPAYGWLALAGLLLVGHSWSYLEAVPRGWPQSVLASANHTGFALCCVTLILAVRRAKIWDSWACQPFVFAGTVCYSAYIIHALLLDRMDWPKGIDLETLLAFGRFAFGTFLLSAISFATIEAIGIRHLPAWAQWTRLVRGGSSVLNPTIWHKCNPVVPRRTIDGSWTKLTQTWRRQRKDGKWEYRQGEPTVDDWSNRPY